MNPVSEKPSWWNSYEGGHCRCGAWWMGLSRCHCAACHRTFTGITAFDSHRRDGVCLDPDGTLAIKDEAHIIGSVMWAWPGRDERWGDGES